MDVYKTKHKEVQTHDHTINKPKNNLILNLIQYNQFLDRFLFYLAKKLEQVTSEVATS